MIGKNFIFDGNSIPYSTAEGVANGWLLDFDWVTPAVRNSTQSRQDFHGTISHPTFAEGRLIAVKGEIFHANKTNRGTIRKAIQDIFRLENFPTRENQYKVLQFTDDDGTDWFIRAKVFALPEFTHERAEPIINVFFQLYAEDPLIRSLVLQSETGSYGLLGGISLPATLPVALGGALNSFVANNAGNFASPAILTVTVNSAIGQNQNIVQYQTSMDGTQDFGADALEDAYSYLFTAAESKLGAVTVALGKEGAPTDEVRVGIYSDDGGGRPDTLLGSATIAAADLPAVAAGVYQDLEINTVIIDLDTNIGTDYHVVVERTGAFNAGNYFRVGVYSVDDGNASERNTGVWGAYNQPLYMKIHRPNSIVDPKIYNLTTGRFFGVSATLYKDNTLIIDTDNRTMEIDGVSVLADREAGSNWIFLTPGDNALLLTGDNFDFAHQDQANLLVEYYHTRM